MSGWENGLTRAKVDSCNSAIDKDSSDLEWDIVVVDVCISLNS